MKSIIIAEAGINHNGDILIAKKLIDAASKTGADFIKFQTFKTEFNISKKAEKAVYQKINTQDKTESQYEMVKKLELSFENFEELKTYCEKREIGFLSTGFDYPSIDFLDRINIPFFKIASGEIVNKPFLEYIAKKGKPIVLSTGMSSLGEIEEALNIFLNEGISRDQITILHCTTEYPTPINEVNLNAMITIGDAFKTKIGYSDHTQGIEIPIAAAALGANVIEKHFTLDRKMDGPDHKASLEPDEFKEMVRAIRNIEMAMGNGIKMPSISEIKNIKIARKSIHYAQDLEVGTSLDFRHFVMKRPGDGISPMDYELLIGKQLVRKVYEEEKVNWSDFK